LPELWQRNSVIVFPWTRCR